MTTETLKNGNSSGKGTGRLHTDITGWILELALSNFSLSLTLLFFEK